ncbi:hypothetical protein AYL99_08831 [Fonsecaea erecta]|uniref:Wings apart-like protein C-terminal domain-containing protein n=1 Tax=Fonsecaea erecta TaxID=1367422 RepID=A0A178ZAC5_9EURO|nr:hypothetical protein AYL99_08831 [Fonsecaea erecta]OAP56719.1 hypothetical protein AYL99_08831 [Fonsecaea erecta]
MYHSDDGREKPSSANAPSLFTTTESSTMFDARSSEEESTRLKPQYALKRRKIIPTKASQPENDMQVAEEPKPVMVKTKELRIRDERVKEKLYPKPVNTNVVREHSKSANIVRRLKRPVKGPASGISESHGKLVPSKAPCSHQPQVSGVSPPEESDSSTRSQSSRTDISRRKRRGPDGSLMVSPTPSDLHPTTLRLTPESSSQKLQGSSEDEHMEDVPSRPTWTGRTRLVDRLDAPRAQRIDTSSCPSSHEQHFNEPNGDAVSLAEVPARRLTKHDSDLEKKPSNGPVAAPSGRQRVTYAKQRSYLSEMADSSEGYSASNSHPSSQEILSKALNFTSGVSHMELDNDDSDEADSFSRIKSIHELRRGGAIRKFDLELDTILEDVESGSKPRRVPGLLQLVTKLDELSFQRHFQDSGGLQRIMDCANASLDQVSATLMALVLHCIGVAESSSPRTVLQILNALYQLPPRLVSEPRSLTKLAKDRSQNLSKALVKDVSEFEEKRSKLLDQTCVAVNRTILSSIESTLRNLIALKEPFPKLPRELLDEILTNFAKTQDMITGGGMAEHLETIRLLLSILEIACANREVTGSTLSTARIVDLGESMAVVMKEAHETQPQIEHSCLRLIVSLSNNDATACDALVDGRVVYTVFQVIEDQFLELTKRVTNQQEVDHARLESVILAVGCLLNLAECSDAARVRMLRLTADGKNMVDRLVDIFNSHVDQTSKAMTIDQTQILVAFGYISALLCTLCLNPMACEWISRSIKGKGLSPLLVAADTFLHHLRTVEMALGEEGSSSSGFTGRFTAVLETVKQHDGALLPSREKDFR